MACIEDAYYTSVNSFFQVLFKMWHGIDYDCYKSLT